jgi:hypothetical protein
MDKEVFANISKIIERDSKSTTYKFALLRGVIDIIEDNSPYITQVSGRVQIPTGLLIEKWLIYYYPILQSETSIPQINGDVNLAFGPQLKEIINKYELRGGFSAFYNDLKNKGIPSELSDEFFELIKKIRETITKMPMKYIGRSISNDFYSIFDYENPRMALPVHLNIEYLIQQGGTFSIPLEYYEAFKIFGSFINGQNSILFKWAQFSVNASGQNLAIENVINEVLKSPITARNIDESKRIYRDILKQEGKVHCVWTGKQLFNYDIDHVIPFSIWKNNDLWNLLPSDAKINNQKRDRIPSPALIEKQKDLILNYWQIIQESQDQRFQREMQVALLGNRAFSSWKESGLTQLQSSCNYLIENRGFEAWSI